MDWLLCPWGFSRQEYWSGLPCLPSGDLPNPGIEPGSPALQADSLPCEPQGIFPTQESNCGLPHCWQILMYNPCLILWKKRRKLKRKLITKNRYMLSSILYMLTRIHEFIGVRNNIGLDCHEKEEQETEEWGGTLIVKIRLCMGCFIGSSHCTTKRDWQRWQLVP